MHLLIYLVLCSGFFFSYVTCFCDGSKECALHEWIVTDCQPCCEIDASPYSAVLKRSLCCPKGTYLAQCISLCNFTNDEVEQNGQCTVHCQTNCTGGFHFETNTTLTTMSPTKITPLTTYTEQTTTISATTTRTKNTPSTSTTDPTSTTSTTTTQTVTSTSTTPKTTTISTPTTSSSIATTTTLTSATAKAKTTAQTTTVPTITPTVSSDFYPLYLSSIKNPLKEKSTKPKACTTQNNHLKGIMASLFFVGAGVGVLATLSVIWFLKKRKERMTVQQKEVSTEPNDA